MSDKAWKAEERAVGRLFGGARYAANVGGLIDVESDLFVVQVKHRARLSLAEVEALALEMERIGFQRSKLGAVVVKRRAGGGRKTPRLVIVTEAVWREMTGARP